MRRLWWWFLGDGDAAPPIATWAPVARPSGGNSTVLRASTTEAS